jgi:hypothetical protein
MDNAPSGASSISMLDGSWEMEARWVLKVARTAGDWNEPLYTWYLLVKQQSSLGLRHLRTEGQSPRSLERQ